MAELVIPPGVRPAIHNLCGFPIWMCHLAPAAAVNIRSVLWNLVPYPPFTAPRNTIHWVIAGGESGPRARPCDLDWLRSVRDQCQLAGVPFFLKQLGGYPDKRGHEKAVLDGQRWLEMPEISR